MTEMPMNTTKKRSHLDGYKTGYKIYEGGQVSILSLSNVFGADDSGCKRAGLAPYLNPPARCRCKAPSHGLSESHELIKATDSMGLTNYITVKLPKGCSLYLTEAEYIKALRRGKAFIRAKKFKAQVKQKILKEEGKS